MSLQDILKTCDQSEYIFLDQYVLKTSSEDRNERCLQDIFKDVFVKTNVRTNQLTFTIRYLLETAPVKRFLCFTPMKSREGKEIVSIILVILRFNNILLQNCQGQSCANY